MKFEIKIEMAICSTIRELVHSVGKSFTLFIETSNLEAEITIANARSMLPFLASTTL